ncbi:MAG: bifunctional phosphoribosyl-AMP cyclohydrolase/phosphoribosyl-ATP diphosphatase HisIE [Proteobacteria bacterium]|nr:bifunctional phosphoribosyl-AMP cyclohydrolase/phosphoribosyl-ATP diphosphatase HisIE [Cystobacterineae bacterium]MCL2258685.1 bifunctional phosphoribosyl-AMP cyclohydrolase/phosphoribosyl-ATP diphosphatase HisIE [Cystobacterineae bacterium]MCL2313988.1 bifunctional phosphoribosyl-AMP cyclohydrolase/phosphoribosyl-ATP diphosphatase HisIE [Pseudomonadota bacterium]
MKVPNLRFDENGLAPAVIQHALTGEVLMVAYMNAQSLQKTVETGRTWFFSRSRKQLWNKGESSGHFQEVVSMEADCDSDTLLVRVLPHGPACHNLTRSCFPNSAPSLLALDDVLAQRMAEGVASGYTHKLLADENLRLKKLGEETVELVMALVQKDKARAIEEAGDVLYHLLVALRAAGANLETLLAALAARAKPKS